MRKAGALKANKPHPHNVNQQKAPAGRRRGEKKTDHRGRNNR
jgi:hypothetical protein